MSTNGHRTPSLGTRRDLRVNTAHVRARMVRLRNLSQSLLDDLTAVVVELDETRARQEEAEHTVLTQQHHIQDLEDVVLHYLHTVQFDREMSGSIDATPAEQVLERTVNGRG